MSYTSQFLWVIFPYMMIAITIIGHVYRYNTDQMGWTTKSSEFLEKKNLRLGSMLFHYGAIFVIAGHVLGLLIPKSFVSSIGIDNALYHQIAISTGSIAGIATTVGLLILLFRRFGNKRISITSSYMDKLILVLLFIEMLLGLYNTIVHNLVFGDYYYRGTISVWFRDLFVFAPNAKLMLHVPLGYKIHIILAFAIFGLWPFTRLVHVWSIPIAYMKRTRMIYRRRCGDIIE